MSLLLLSLKSAVAVACEMVTAKSVAFKLPRVFRLRLLGVPAVVVTGAPTVPVVEVLVVELILLCNITVALVGGLMPRVRDLSRLTCMMATSTRTSDLGLSRSLTSFWANAI